MILVCGEALFDIFLAGESPEGRMALDASPGGSPFNVAIGLARLGRESGFFGGLSRDLFGERLANILTREHVDISRCVLSQAPTTLAFVELAADKSARYAFRGAGAADRALLPSDLPALDDSINALAFGSYTTVVQPVGDTLLEFAKREAGKRVIIYDPNVRPTVEPDLDIWRERFDAFAETATILKASDEDLALLAPGASVDDFATAAIAQGVSLVVVTHGSEGAIAFGAFGRIALPTVATDVVDTVGAGDTVTAALITWLDEMRLLTPDAIAHLPSLDARAALTFAMEAAAITCGRRGANLPRRAELIHNRI
ncbi:carbohydrate kinase [Terrarubrum flagellatum]|uniref:carbohydrate kinase family protein n=1 Tax=Terrirubrum flagellatum TaxID=2895980 RepID=UPI0031453512